MKKLLFVALILLSLVNGNAQTRVHYPSLKEVVDEFGAKYSYTQSGASWLKLAKSPKGWVLYEQTYTDGKFKDINPTVFWDSKTQTYQALKAPFYTSPGRTNALQTAIQYDVYRFERNYYYGYEGDNMDVIRELGGIKNLSDTALDGLARAYSSHALWFIQDGAESKVPNDETVPENLADSFMVYVDKAIETFGRLVKQAPHYETIVGNIYMKRCNEYMYAYTVLAEWGYEEKGRKYLVDGLYGEALLDMARNYFYSMEDNSIFFSWGDNDTYPLIYLQQKLGFKKGVNVVNISLLGAPRYINCIRNGYGGLPKVKMTLPQVAYNSGKLDYIALAKSEEEEDAEIKTLEQLLQKIAANYYKPLIGPGTFTIGVNKSGISIPVNRGYCIANNLLPPEGNNPTEITLKLNKGMYINDIAVLDILNANNWERPVYFANGYNQLDFDDYLRWTGVVKLLQPLNNETTETTIDEKRLTQNLMKRFVFSPKNGYIGSKGNGFNVNTYSVRKAYFHLADETTDKTKKAEVARKGLAIIPNSYTPYDDVAIQLAEVLAKAGAVPEAQKELMIAVNSLYDGYLHPKPLYQFWYNKATEKETLRNLLSYAHQIAETYAMDELKQTLTNLAQKLDEE